MEASSVLGCLFSTKDRPELCLLITPTIPNGVVAFHLTTTEKDISKLYSTLLIETITTTPDLIIQSTKYCQPPA